MDTDERTDAAVPATTPERDPWVPDETGISPGARELSARILASPMPESCVDENGRIKTMTEEENQRRARAFEKAMKELAQITDETDTEEMWREVAKGIDQHRPHRPLFREYY